MKSIKANIPTLVLTVIEIVVGILLIVNPIGFTSAIIRAVGIGMTVGGAIWCIKYFRTEKMIAATSGILFEGIICLLVGIFLMAKSTWIISAFTAIVMLYAIMIVLIGVLKIQWTVDLIRFQRSSWGVVALSSLVAIIFGALIIFNPFHSTEILWRLCGICLLAQAVFDLISLFTCPRVVPSDKVVDVEAKEVEEETEEGA